MEKLQIKINMVESLLEGKLTCLCHFVLNEGMYLHTIWKPATNEWRSQGAVHTRALKYGAKVAFWGNDLHFTEISVKRCEGVNECQKIRG